MWIVYNVFLFELYFLADELTVDKWRLSIYLLPIYLSIYLSTMKRGRALAIQFHKNRYDDQLTRSGVEFGTFFIGLWERSTKADLCCINREAVFFLGAWYLMVFLRVSYKHKPLHVFPSPEKPSLHVQVKDPRVFVHWAFTSQAGEEAVHSSTSEQKQGTAKWYMHPKPLELLKCKANV